MFAPGHPVDMELTVPKMGADKLAENIPKASKSICPICLPKPKSSELQ